ncbi:hypothetical protein CDD82_2630 [Ophiocordyceps australis]|uniref:Uncharacterized protein n=1 Tax=Ophiocordyceps australis TaxID=1399860 RepID=A0A2C5XTY5_9HYPO|nr:hypothetical protein CDD82_2630 [Ophiocordyceps australis]
MSESSVALGGDHAAIKLVLNLSFVGSVDRELGVRRAWQACHRQYPALGAFVVSSPQGDSGSPARLVSSPFDSEAWDKATFIVCHDQDAIEVCEKMNSAPMPICHWLPASSEVVIRMSHWRVDGMGIFMIGHRFLAHLAEIMRRGPETCCIANYIDHLPILTNPLPPTVESLLQKQEKQEKITPDIERAFERLAKCYAQHSPGIVFPPRHDTCETLPSTNGHATIRLDAATTRQVSAARRANDYSFTAAVHAALIRAMTKCPQKPLVNSYASFYLIDLRKSFSQCASVAAQDNCPIGFYIATPPLYLGGLGLDQRPSINSYDEIARKLSLIYRQGLPNIHTAFGGGPAAF